jgi:hypothetical protein
MKLMKSKKVAALVSGLLAVGMALSFTACGGDNNPTNATGKTHDPVTLQVTGKTDEYIPHDFVDGKCKYCSETTIFTQDPIGGTDVLTKACSEQGTVEKIEYTTYTYHKDAQEEVTKTAYVYLPYGYNAEDTTSHTGICKGYG